MPRLAPDLPWLLPLAAATLSATLTAAAAPASGHGPGSGIDPGTGQTADRPEEPPLAQPPDAPAPDAPPAVNLPESAAADPTPAQQVMRAFERQAPRVGEPLPDVELLDAAGNPFHLRALRGSHSVLVFGCLT
jgi:hypothetical protein